MEEEKKYTVDQAHRFFGVEFNNKIFQLADKEKLSEDEKEEAIACAFASLLHWKKFSGHKTVNTQRALYMISKSFILAEQKQNALSYANKCYQFTQDNISEVQDFDIAYSYEIMARAAALNGKVSDFETYCKKAKEAMANIKNEEDLKWLKLDFEGGNWFGMKI